MQVKLLPGTEAWLKKQKDKNAIVQNAIFQYRKKLTEETKEKLTPVLMGRL